ncbi:hypothetical protein HPP92_026871, partial [Vanilla planifolia]
QFQVGIITFDMFLNVTYLAIVTHLQELEELIARDLYISSDQVKNNLNKVLVTEFDNVHGNIMMLVSVVQVIIARRLIEHHPQLPNTFGSYSEVVRWNVEPIKK